MYKITFRMKSPIAFIDRLCFDGVLAWCYLKDKHGIVEQKQSYNNPEDLFNDMPILKHPDGWFIASWMLYDEEQAVESTGSWKKRWANEHDHFADFGKKKAAVMINKGDHKSYDMPIVIQRIAKVWFYFASDNVDRVRALVQNHLWGLGKKTGMGFGEIESFEIEAVTYDPFITQIIRPVPAKDEDLKNLNSLNLRMMGWRPPYWAQENQAFCIV